MIAKVTHNFIINPFNLPKNLPEGWKIYENAMTFPIGYHEEYIVDGRMYNPEGNLSLKQQQEKIRGDLKAKGYTENEANEFINSLPVEEWGEQWLNLEQSYEKIDKNPELQSILSKTFSNIRAELEEQEKRLKSEPKIHKRRLR